MYTFAVRGVINELVKILRHGAIVRNPQTEF